MEKEVKSNEQKPADAPAAEVADEKKGSEIVAESKHSNNNVLVIVLVVVGALVVLGIGGSILAGKIFKKAATSVVENATGTKVSTDSKGNTTVTTNNGSVTTSTEQKLPTDFPSSIPLLASQTITDSYKSKNTLGDYWQVSAQTSDSVSSAVKSLKDKYASWELVSETENDGSFTINYKNSTYSVVLSVTDNNSKTTVTYMVSKENTTE